LLRKLEHVLKENVSLGEFLETIEVYRVNNQKMQNKLRELFCHIKKWNIK